MSPLVVAAKNRVKHFLYRCPPDLTRCLCQSMAKPPLNSVLLALEGLYGFVWFEVSSCCLSISSSTGWSALNVSGCLGVPEGNPLPQTLRKSRPVRQGSGTFGKTAESLFQWDCLSCYSMVGGMLSHQGIWANPAGIRRNVWSSPWHSAGRGK